MCAFCFNDTATTEIYTLSLHDALPIYGPAAVPGEEAEVAGGRGGHLRGELPAGVQQPDVRAGHGVAAAHHTALDEDRKSTRLNSSHANISYAVFCLKKKKKTHNSVSVT